MTSRMGQTGHTILCVVGTRPEAVKMAPVIRALRSQRWARVVVAATAQHRELLDQIFEFFQIRPDVDLNLMRPNQSLAELTSRMVAGMDRVLAEEQPDIVLAQGDTTTVMVTALCAYHRRMAFGHVEAGLRTGDKYAPFPEEMNRVLTAHLADLHFAPTPEAADNLRREGVAPERIFVTGNTVIDALQWAAGQRLPPVVDDPQRRKLILVTAHRRENFGDPLERICDALLELAARPDVLLLYPVHPNPNVAAVVHRRLGGRENIRLVPPLDYPQFVAAMKHAYLILTDSGGVQEEAPTLGKPVLVLRESTERPEGVQAGTACLVGTDPAMIISVATRLLDDASAYDRMAQARNPYGDGQAAARIVEALQQWLARAAPPAKVPTPAAAVPLARAS
jgi:UDP-N-acetylglucosamine 2-epimerase (non-hydrolysing)